jgi:hypothetical protein
MLDPKQLPNPEVVGEPALKKQTSPAKIEANRQNSRNSTGPNTPQGKKNSSRNARKHGLLTKDFVIITGAGKENQAGFDQLLSDLRDIYPQENLELDLLVQELAASWWRSARAQRAERGELTLKSEMPHQSPELSELELRSLALFPDADVRAALLTSSRGLSYLLRELRDIMKVVLSIDCFPPESRKLLPPAEVWNGGASKKEMLVALKEEIADLTMRKEQAQKNEMDQRDAQIDCAAIPGKEALDRLHRYETSNQRHRYKLLTRLDQLLSRQKQAAEDHT